MAACIKRGRSSTQKNADIAHKNGALVRLGLRFFKHGLKKDRKSVV